MRHVPASIAIIVNESVRWLGSPPQTSPPRGHRHVDHHRRSLYGTREDGEYLPLGVSTPWMIVLYLSQILFIPLLTVVRFGLLTPLTWSQTRPHVEGAERLETVTGPVVFVANHASHLDAPLILCSLPKAWRRRTAIGAAADYFFDVWWRAAGTALAFNAFPVERSGGKRLSDTPWRLLQEGWSVVVFPEGTRSHDGWVGRFRPGAARLCVGARVPAIPVAVRGTFAAMPRGRSWPQPGRYAVSVRFGPPIQPREEERPREFLDRLADGVARLWDEDGTTWWESMVRSSREGSPQPSGPPGPRWRRPRWSAAETSRARNCAQPKTMRQVSS
jgi:1-acyl-sn-glycerol-3-phosphate acyltransferase